jgi:DNA helicase II / ATP-dependent DNA helicase PcrA
MQFSKQQQEVMATDGHLLITGGPGSGKTTISIYKAAQIAERDLQPGQKILFLSFARATVARVIQAIENEKQIRVDEKRLIEVETYHSFFWRILKTHGYLLGLSRCPSILKPSDEAVILSPIRTKYGREKALGAQEKAAKRAEEDEARRRLCFSEGRICFDLFAPLVGNLLLSSDRLCRLISTMYPVVILDEFQDTNAPQWHCVSQLGKHGRIIALADPEQRIFDFAGADPERINHFRDAYAPVEIDFNTQNHRSAGTDIAEFGNDILTGTFRSSKYLGVDAETYPSNENQACTSLMKATYAARKRLSDSKNPDWSLAILVPTKKLTRFVSDKFRNPPAGMQPIAHSAVIDLDAAILGSELLAFILQPRATNNDFDVFIDLLCNYLLGKGGDKPTKTALEQAGKLRKAYSKWQTAFAAGKTSSAKSIILALATTYQTMRALVFSGNPDRDWLTVRSTFEVSSSVLLKEIATELLNVRLLERGTQLRHELAQDWLDNGAYTNALAIVRTTFVKQHFATSGKSERGVVVMNMHKAKGKQFDEVIIFEGWPRRKKTEVIANFDRIVPDNDKSKISSEVRQNLRVSVTRARRRVTLLTPQGNVCAIFAN